VSEPPDQTSSSSKVYLLLYQDVSATWQIGMCNAGQTWGSDHFAEHDFGFLWRCECLMRFSQWYKVKSLVIKVEKGVHFLSRFSESLFWNDLLSWRANLLFFCFRSMRKPTTKENM
jgi:hypothetical protein